MVQPRVLGEAIGQVILVPEAVTALDTLRNAWGTVVDAGDARGELVRVVQSAVFTLRDVARRDLLEEAPAARAS